jgi:polyadenylate-binding protein 2
MSEEQLSYEEDPELLEAQRKLDELEAEAARLEQINVEDADMDEDTLDTSETDKRSVYVGSVDYGATPQELQEHFRSCGIINRITILVDKYTGHPKGFAYVEFADEAGVQNAILLNDTMFRGRQIKVTSKRTNLPGLKRGRGRGRGRASPFMPTYMPYMPRGRGVFRARGRGGFGYRPY